MEASYPDWYVSVVLKNQLRNFFYARAFKIFQQVRKRRASPANDECLHGMMSVYMGWWENRLAYYTEISLDSSEIPPTGLARLSIQTKRNNQEEDNYPVRSRLPGYPGYLTDAPQI